MKVLNIAFPLWLRSLHPGGPAFIASINHMALINSGPGSASHERLLACLETMSGRLMTARAKQTAECMTCLQICSCLGLYSNKHHQFCSVLFCFVPYEGTSERGA